METVNACPLCGFSAYKDIYKTDQLHYVACAGCSLVFLSRRPGKEDYSHLYESVFQDKRRQLTTKEEAIARLENKKSYEEKKEYLPYLKSAITRESACLEIGGGWGTLGKVLRDYIGCSIDEVETSHLAAQVAAEYYGLSSFNTDFDSFVEHEGRGKQYDCILLVHVFEHLLDPNAFLEKVKMLLKKNGALFLAMPDVLNPDGLPERFFHVEHCFYYSPKTIALMLLKHGLCITKLWRTRMDMRLLCAPNMQAATPDFNNAEEYIAVMRAMQRVQRKYGVLRQFKRAFGFILRPAQLERAAAAAAQLLRAVRVIKV